MNIKIAHTAYQVTDMDKALAFYVGVLGCTHAFTLCTDASRPEKPTIEYLKVCPGQFIELFYAKEPLHQGNDVSYRHLCLQVDDCEAAAKELAQKGVAVTNGPKQGKDTNWQCWIRDPDGNPIEIMQINPTSPQARA